ncbi:hypothetical protein KXR53_13375 [Inquilinus limosus]|uniref:hypothetical protein n=1 Tax=Inquilinus limosus TaxID=171674 RepID=UPI003F14653A
MVSLKMMATVAGLAFAAAALPAAGQGVPVPACNNNTVNGCPPGVNVQPGGPNGLGLRGNGSGVSAMDSHPVPTMPSGGPNGLGLRGSGTGVSAMGSSQIVTPPGALDPNGLGLRGTGVPGQGSAY